LKKLTASHGEQLALALDPASVADERGSTAPDVRTRRAIVGNDVIGYRLRRARRRTIGFQIDDHGLTISAPRWVTLREIEVAIAEKQRWIRNKHREWREWREKRRLPQVVFADGGVLPYLGRQVTLRLVAEAGTTRLSDAAAEIHLALPREAGTEQVRDSLQAWLQVEARRVFGERLANFADRIDARFAGWKLSSARSQWGSCTHDGRIRLNWRLVHFSLPVIDYVIAHELAHLRELNHNPRFWHTVAQLLPGFEAARDEIRQVDIAALPV
jgi:predicted metal-dependent hydrolase